MSSSWTVERCVDTVERLHALGVPQNPVRTLRWCVPTDGALVLGSAQPETDVDHEALQKAGLGVVRRKSGGGAVLVEPGDMVWVDVIIPKGDSLWTDDVGVAFHWLGHVWAGALGTLTKHRIEVHEGALVSSEWSRTACFAGLGPGECLVDERKAVGISQRRTREGAVFQCAVLFRFDSQRLAGLLALDAGQKADLIGSLDITVGALVGVSAESVEEAFTTWCDVVDGWVPGA